MFYFLNCLSQHDTAHNKMPMMDATSVAIAMVALAITFTCRYFLIYLVSSRYFFMFRRLITCCCLVDSSCLQSFPSENLLDRHRREKHQTVAKTHGVVAATRQPDSSVWTCVSCFSSFSGYRAATRHFHKAHPRGITKKKVIPPLTLNASYIAPVQAGMATSPPENPNNHSVTDFLLGWVQRSSTLGEHFSDLFALAEPPSSSKRTREGLRKSIAFQRIKHAAARFIVDIGPLTSRASDTLRQLVGPPTRGTTDCNRFFRALTSRSAEAKYGAIAALMLWFARSVVMEQDEDCTILRPTTYPWISGLLYQHVTQPLPKEDTDLLLYFIEFLRLCFFVTQDLRHPDTHFFVYVFVMVSTAKPASGGWDGQVRI